MKLNPINKWDLPPSEAIRIQQELALQVAGGSLPRKGTILGLDVSYRRGGDLMTACAVLLTFPQMRPQQAWTRKGNAGFPYVPGLLSFREIPGVEITVLDE